MSSRNLRLVLATITTVFSFVGCAKAPDTQLGNPPTATGAPGPVSETPKTPNKTPDTTPDSSPTPTPAPVPSVRYRFMCEASPSITSVSSIATPQGFGADILFGLANNGSGEFDPAISRNLDLVQQVVLVPGQNSSQGGEVLFLAKEVSSRGSTFDSMGVYVSRFNLPYRRGTAIQLAKVSDDLAIDGSSQQMAEREGLTIRNFGVSQYGRFFIVPSKKGFTLLREKDRTIESEIAISRPAGATRGVNPTFDESHGLFSVSYLESNAWTTRFYTLGTSLTIATEVKGLRRPLKAMASATPNAAFYYGISVSGQLVVVDPLKSSKSLSIDLPQNSTDGVIASAVALREQPIGGTTTGGTLKALELTTVFENVSIVSVLGGGSAYKVSSATVRKYEVELGTGVARFHSEVPYPSLSKVAIEKQPVRIHAGLHDLVVTPDQREVFGLFPGRGSHQIYRIESPVAVAVSQAGCDQFSVGVE